MYVKKKWYTRILAICLVIGMLPLPAVAMSTAEAEALPLPESNCGVPLYFQNDYAHVPYGDGTMATSGCGPTCLAMAATHLTGYPYTPDLIAAYFPGGENNVIRMNMGSDGLKLPWWKAKDLNEAVAALKEGDVVIGMMGPRSLFTSTQHFILLSGITEDGLIMVNDPMKPHYSNPLLARALREGFTWGEMAMGFEGGWVYDVSAMQTPEYQHTPYIEPRYPHIELCDADKELIAKVMLLEAGDKSARCQQAIAEVLLNRMLNWGFSDYLPGVLYSENHFSGPLYRSPLPDLEPGEEQYAALEKAYSGPYVLTDWVVYFGEHPRNDMIWGEIDGLTFCNYF